MKPKTFSFPPVHGGKEQEAREPRHSDDAVQPAHIQQGKLPVDQVRGEVPVGHLQPSVPADAGFPRRGAGEGTLFLLY